MDVYCPICGEPWNLDEFHEIEGCDFKTGWNTFITKGCSVFNQKCNKNKNKKYAMMAKAIYEVLGNDPDGCAATFEDSFLNDFD